MIQYGGFGLDNRVRFPRPGIAVIRNQRDMELLFELETFPELRPSWIGPTNPSQAIICDTLDNLLEVIVRQSVLKAIERRNGF
jgi:hypothetical protein